LDVVLEFRVKIKLNRFKEEPVEVKNVYTMAYSQTLPKRIVLNSKEKLLFL